MRSIALSASKLPGRLEHFAIDSTMEWVYRPALSIQWGRDDDAAESTAFRAKCFRLFGLPSVSEHVAVLSTSVRFVRSADLD
jgi:hypothetical protein